MTEGSCTQGFVILGILIDPFLGDHDRLGEFPLDE